MVAEMFSITETQSQETNNTIMNEKEHKDDSSKKPVPADDISMDSFCEVVVIFRCKFCPYTAEDKISMKLHISKLHSTSNNLIQDSIQQKVVDGDNLEKSCTDKILEPFKNSSKNLPLPENGLQSTGQEVFFCSECSIIFSSAKLCCDHMTQVHNLTEFSTELIRENPLNSQTEHNKRKRIRYTKQESAPEKIAKLTSITKSRSHTKSECMCKLCKTKFNNRNALETHEKCHVSNKDIDHNNQSSLEVMNNNDAKNNNQKKKSNSYSNYVKGYICCHCESDKPKHKFLTWSQCAVHLWKEHQVDCDLYSCTVCQYKTPTLGKLKDHERLHSSEANFKCSTCRKTFKQFKQLKTHEKYHKTNMTQLPPPTDTRWYTPKECPVCHRILSDSKCLKKHISAVHNKMKPFACNICNHTSARKAELDLHVRQHTGEKPFKCSYCPFATGDHNSLRKHKMRHGGIKPYRCAHCDFSCIQSHAYKKHVLNAHPGEDIVFVCQFCPLVCVNEKSFEAHRKDHEEGRLASTNNGDDPKTSKSTNNDLDPKSVRASNDSTDGSSSDGKFWLRDEDSMEVVDTGGITIKHTCYNLPTVTEMTEQNNSADEVHIERGRDCSMSDQSKSSTTLIPVNTSNNISQYQKEQERSQEVQSSNPKSFLSSSSSLETPNFRLIGDLEQKQQQQQQKLNKNGSTSKSKKASTKSNCTLTKNNNNNNAKKKSKPKPKPKPKPTTNIPTTTTTTNPTPKKPKGKKGKAKDTPTIAKTLISKPVGIEQTRGEFHVITKEKEMIESEKISSSVSVVINSTTNNNNTNNNNVNINNKNSKSKKSNTKKTKKPTPTKSTTNKKSKTKEKNIIIVNLDENSRAGPNQMMECHNNTSNINNNNNDNNNNMVAELLADTDSNSLAQFLEPIIMNGINMSELADMSMFNDHSNDIFI